jgi:hypothetical protein
VVVPLFRRIKISPVHRLSGGWAWRSARFGLGKLARDQPASGRL